MPCPITILFQKNLQNAETCRNVCNVQFQDCLPSFALSSFYVTPLNSASVKLVKRSICQRRPQRRISSVPSHYCEQLSKRSCRYSLPAEYYLVSGETSLLSESYSHKDSRNANEDG